MREATNNRSLWQLQASNATQQFGNRCAHADVAIIGAGLTGLSAAYHLLEQSPGRKVVVLDAADIGAGASGHSTGMLTPGIGQSLPAMIKRLGADTARRAYQASLDAVQYVQSLLQRLNIDCQLRMTGQLIVSPPDRHRQRRLAALLKAFQQLDLPHQCWDMSVLGQRAAFAVPQQPIADNALAAIRIPDAGTLHPGLLLEELANLVINLGGEIYTHSPVASILDHPATTVNLANGGTLTADKVVVATSGYSGSLGLMKGRVLPVHLAVVATEPMTSRQLAALQWPGRECVIDCRRLFNYFRLTEDNRIVFGGGMPRYRWGGRLGQATGSNKDLNALGRDVRAVFKDLSQLNIETAWTGVIGYVLDTMPTIRALQPNVYYLGAWSGHGIALSIQSGAWIRDLIDNRQTPDDLPWFNHMPPRIPTEIVRWGSFKTGVAAMALLDKYLPEYPNSRQAHQARHVP